MKNILGNFGIDYGKRSCYVQFSNIANFGFRRNYVRLGRAGRKRFSVNKAEVVQCANSGFTLKKNACGYWDASHKNEFASSKYYPSGSEKIAETSKASGLMVQNCDTEVEMEYTGAVSIICDRDGKFTSNFWRTFQKALGTSLDMSTALPPQLVRRKSRRRHPTSRHLLRAWCSTLKGLGRLARYTYWSKYLGKHGERSSDQQKNSSAQIDKRSVGKGSCDIKAGGNVHEAISILSWLSEDKLRLTNVACVGKEVYIDVRSSLWKRLNYGDGKINDCKRSQIPLVKVYVELYGG
ncbi:reverse transcriptase domain-containing protein [Tanacetum coccineum]